MTMTPKERKRAVEDQYGSISNLARHLSKGRKRAVRREELSMCINGLRVYPKLQIQIARAIDRPVEEVFGDPTPKTQAA